MVIIIIAVILGLEIGYFSTQNTGLISLHFGPYSSPNMPLYLAVVGAFLLGLLIAWLFSFIHSFSSSLTLHGKENKIKDANKTIAQLTKSVHQLELDNARLREKSGEEESTDDKSL